MVEVSGTSSFCSNPDALGIDESEKGIFDSHKNIAQLPPSPPKGGNRLGDSGAGTVENPAAEEAGKDFSVAGTGECLDLIDWFFRRAFANVFVFLDKQVGDQPKSPPSATNVDLISLGTPRQELEEPVGESAAISHGILDCHSALVVSDFLYSSSFVELSSTLS